MSEQSWRMRFRAWRTRQRVGRGIIPTLADPEQTRNRAEIITKACQGLLVLHGGAAVALLAFMGQVWGKDEYIPIVLAISNTMVWLVSGLILAIVAMAIRYNTSLEGQFRGTGWLFRLYQYVHRFSLWGSIIMFGVAMWVLLSKVEAALP